jgi:hypothetical protein
VLAKWPHSHQNQCTLKQDWFKIGAWIFALLCAVSPLFASTEIPLVDLPQHLHLISVLHRLGDTSTLFPEYFARRPELTPYLGYYYAVSALNYALPLELANRLFLAAYVAGLPLSLAFLLNTLKKSTWPALLAIPFAYGDSLAWGFINYCAAIPLGVTCCALFVRSIEDTENRKKWSAWLAACLILVLLFHVQVFAFLAVALPFLLFTTKGVGSFVESRKFALIGVLPGVILFLLWIGLRLGAPTEIAPGQPWKAWGPMLSKENLSYKNFDNNMADLVQIPVFNNQNSYADAQFPILAGMTDSPDEHRAIRVSLLLFFAALAVSLFKREKSTLSVVENLRILGLASIAFVLLFTLPFDIRGYMYYLNTRYAHLAMALLVVCVPTLLPRFNHVFLGLAALAAFFFSQPLREGFSKFDLEAKNLSNLSQFAADKPKVMGLIYNTASPGLTHPVFLHSSCVLARAKGGITNFSFASTPHSPLMYVNGSPPTFPSEWRPNEMNWNEHGIHYDHFVIRGPQPGQILGNLLESQLYIAGQSGDFYLVRKRTP